MNIKSFGIVRINGNICSMLLYSALGQQLTCAIIVLYPSWDTFEFDYGHMSGHGWRSW